VEKIITQCSNCQAKFKLGGDKVGKKIRCPKCKGVFVVQELGKTAAPAAPKPAPAPKPEQPKAAPTPPPIPKAPPAPAVSEPEPAPEPKQEVVLLKDRPRPLKVCDFFETQFMRFLPEKAEGVNAHISYEITGEGGGFWTLIVNNGTCQIREGADPTAKSHAKMTVKTYLKLAQGKLDGRVAFMLGKIRIKGDKSSLATVRECFEVPQV
jgi:predicted Zn finger-like uncharacterized protein